MDIYRSRDCSWPTPFIPKPCFELCLYILRIFLESKLLKIASVALVMAFARSVHIRNGNIKRRQEAGSTCFKNALVDSDGFLAVPLWLRNLADSDGSYGSFNLSMSKSNQRKLEFLEWEAEFSFCVAVWLCDFRYRTLVCCSGESFFCPTMSVGVPFGVVVLFDFRGGMLGFLLSKNKDAPTNCIVWRLL